MSKVVILFLIFISILGILGKLRLPKLPKLKRKGQIETAKKCSSCGQYLFEGIKCKCKSKTGS